MEWGGRASFIAASACIALAMGVASAQAQTRNANGTDDLRPLYANSADAAEGKRVAESSCVACHGVNGISGTERVPHLATQRSAYLWTELRAYKAGARRSGPMLNAVKFLSDDALLKVAAYYASLEPAPPVIVSGKASPAPSDPVQTGKTAAAACAGCHGETGNSKTSGIPSLAGLNQKYFAAAMK